MDIDIDTYINNFSKTKILCNRASMRPGMNLASRSSATLKSRLFSRRFPTGRCLRVSVCVCVSYAPCFFRVCAFVFPYILCHIILHTMSHHLMCVPLCFHTSAYSVHTRARACHITCICVQIYHSYLLMGVCICIYMWIYMYIHIYIHTYIFSCTYIHTYMYVCMYVCIYMCICM